MSKWSTCYFFDSQNSIERFWDSYYPSQEQKKILIVMGKGFDPRMNNVLQFSADKLSAHPIYCLSIDYPAGHPTEVDDFYHDNVDVFNDIVQKKSITNYEIKMDSALEWHRRIKLLCRDLAKFDYNGYTDIIVDVSSLPRSIYFNAIKVIYDVVNEKTNVFLAVTENVEIDKLIRKEYLYDEVSPLWGFEGNYKIESQIDQKRIFVPLLGENHKLSLDKIYENFNSDDVCPVLPFPSRNPRRSDDLLAEYRGFLEDRIHIAPQDITYADERNPFELYRILNRMILDYKETLFPISKNVCFGFALLTSKLQSLGALLIGLEYPKETTMYDPISRDYKITDKEKIRNEIKNSEIFLLWIKGEPYYE